MRRQLVAALCLTVVAAAGCGTFTRTAAKVNGEEISQSTLDDELEAILGNETYRESLELQVGPVQGTGAGTFDADFAAQALTRRIFFELIHQEVERRGIRIGRAELRAARTVAAQQVGGERVLNAFPDGYRDGLVRSFAEVSALQRALAGEDGSAAEQQDPRAYYDANPDEFVEVCASHILLETREAAEEVRQQLLAGADFAELARTRSTDLSAAQNGGSLPCGPPGTYVAEFEAAAQAAEIGQVTEPIQTGFGFHLIKVASRRVVPFEEVEDDIAVRLRAQGQQGGQQAFDEFLQKATAEADVEVDPRYGRWVRDETGGRVVPREGPTTTVAPSAPGGAGGPGGVGGPGGAGAGGAGGAGGG